MPAPIEIEPPRIGVDLDRDTVLGTSLKDFVGVDLIARAPQQLPAGHVAQNRRERIGDCPNDARRLLLEGQPETAVNARHHKIEPG